MKIVKIWLAVALLLLNISTLVAQGQGDNLKLQAEQALEKKEYIKARFNYLQAYQAYIENKQYDLAGACCAQCGALYSRESLYKEAFDLFHDADILLAKIERTEGKNLATARYPIVKERLRIYIKVRGTERANDYMKRLADLAKRANNDSLSNDLLLVRANYFFTFGKNKQGDETINELIGRYQSDKSYDKIKECYTTLIDVARQSGNATLLARTYDKYIAWSDSVNALQANQEYAKLKAQYGESLNTIEEKEHSLTSKQYIIIALGLLIAILAGALVIGAVILLRFILLTRKQKRAIDMANENNEQKSHFILNIAAQMEPTLDTLPANLPGVQALREFLGHIQELSELEQSLSVPYEMEDKSVNTFCEELAAKVNDSLKADVALVVSAPKMKAKIAPEPLEKVLLHLLNNAALYTPEGGKIWLDYKKRGAHTHQFTVSDTGCGIEEEKRENLFKPFTEIKDLNEGDGLGLPICALMAMKMNGTLSIDPTFTKGTRFVLELHV